MIRLAHISDTHFGTEIPKVLSALLLTLDTLRPEIILLSGDITQRAHWSQFSAAKQMMKAFPYATQLVIPGNHDLPLFNIFARFLKPYHNYEYFFGKREWQWQQDNLTILGFDATHPLRHKDGKISIKTLRQRLDEIKSTHHNTENNFVLLSIHQPLYTAWVEDKTETLWHRKELASVLSEYKIDGILSGHVHVPLITTSDNLIKTDYSFMILGAGTAISHRTRPNAPNSFNLLTIEPGQYIEVELYEYGKGEEFHKSSFKRFTKDSRGWN